MILKESELGDPDIIKPILGNPYKEPGKILTATGSSYFFITEISDLDGTPLPLKRENMKGIFQRYEKGLLLFLNGSNYQNAILIPRKRIVQITLSKSEVRRKGGSFISKIFPYIKRELLLVIETDFFRAKMITSFSSFDSQTKYFLNLGYKDKIIIKD